jgi:hypothetical protein
MTRLTSDRRIPILDPVHDGRHSLRDLPLERESIPYVVSLPDHGIGAFVYTWVDKESLAGSCCVAFGPGVGKPIFEAVDRIEVGRTRSFDDWKVGKLHLNHDLKLQTARVRVAGDRIGLDARFEALHPAYAYGFHPDGCPTWAATDRTEQAGRFHGVITIDGKDHGFKSTCARDHSWGTRSWDTPQNWRWLHAQAAETCVHFWQIQSRGRTELRGYVFRDGHMAEVTSAEVDFETDDHWLQRRIAAIVEDTAGRSVRVEGKYFAHYPFLPVPSCTLNEGAMSCTVDGSRGVGWTEFMWPTAYLEHLKNEKATRR